MITLLWQSDFKLIILCHFFLFYFYLLSILYSKDINLDSYESKPRQVYLKCILGRLFC